MLEAKRRKHALNEQEKNDVEFFEAKVRELENEKRTHGIAMQE